MRRKLEADVVQPAKAGAEAKENDARASTAAIIEDGRARADALRNLADSWKKAGPVARDVMLTQKLLPIIQAMTDMVAETKVDKITMIDTGNGPGMASAVSTMEQIKQVFGIDVVEKLKQLGTQPRSQARMIESPSPEAAEKQS